MTASRRLGILERLLRRRPLDGPCRSCPPALFRYEDAPGQEFPAPICPDCGRTVACVVTFGYDTADAQPPGGTT